jgi:hypothetical protein
MVVADLDYGDVWLHFMSEISKNREFASQLEPLRTDDLRRARLHRPERAGWWEPCLSPGDVEDCEVSFLFYTGDGYSIAVDPVSGASYMWGNVRRAIPFE